MVLSIAIHCLPTVKSFQVLQFNTNSSIFTLKYSTINNSIWPIYGTLTATTTPGQNGPESNDNEGVHHIPQSSRTGLSPSDAVLCYIHNTLCVCVWGVVVEFLPFCRDAVGVFYSSH